MPMPVQDFCVKCNSPVALWSDRGLCEGCLSAASDAVATPGFSVSEDDPSLRATPSYAAGATPPLEQTRSYFPARDTLPYTPSEGEDLPESPPGYYLIRALGSGGMGAVYLAFEFAAERVVAVKFIHDVSRRGAFDRFLVEARALARVDHPNIVKVITVAADARPPFFTMEYAEGGTLADLVKSFPALSPHQAVRLMLPVVEAIAAAHAADILHRDIKPRNILVRVRRKAADEGGAGPRSLDDCTPLVSDFGLAKRTDRDEGLTRTGALGTPGYMSPEASAGRHRELTAATDVFGLGATLFFLLTGRAPNTTSDADGNSKVVLEGTPRLRPLRADVPPELEAVVVKALELEPRLRYQTATALADELRRFLAGEPVQTPVLTPRRLAQRWVKQHRGRLGLGMGLVVVGVLLFIIGRSLSPEPQPNPDPDPIPVKKTAEDYFADIREELRRGQSVVLIPDQGEPQGYRWRLGSAAFGKSPLGDGTCYYETLGMSFLELLDDPGIDRYRIRLEIRQVERSWPQAGEEPVCGLYFGYGQCRDGTGFGSDSSFAVTFCDYEKNGADQKLSFQKLFVGHRPPVSPERKPSEFARLRFKPAPIRPGFLRTIEVDVTPERIRVFWLAEENAARQEVLHLKGYLFIPGVEYPEMQKILNAPPYAGRGLVLPTWSPRMPLGLYTYGSAVTIKSLTVTPLK